MPSARYIWVFVSVEKSSLNFWHVCSSDDSAHFTNVTLLITNHSIGGYIDSHSPNVVHPTSESDELLSRCTFNIRSGFDRQLYRETDGADMGCDLGPLWIDIVIDSLARGSFRDAVNRRCHNRRSGYYMSVVLNYYTYVNCLMEFHNRAQLLIYLTLECENWSIITSYDAHTPWRWVACLDEHFTRSWDIQRNIHISVLFSFQTESVTWSARRLTAQTLLRRES